MKNWFMLLLLGAPAISNAEFVVIDSAPVQSAASIQKLPAAYTAAPSNPRASLQTYAAAQAYVRPSPVAAAPAASSSERDRLVQFINQAVLSGQMEAGVALKLMRALMESESGVVSQAALPRPVMQEVRVAAPAIAPAPAPRWMLDTKLTLRENLDAWSKTAGWNPSQWEASNAYQITESSTLDGDFPLVLRQIADSTGLNICAKSREKVVRVTDASVSCK